MKTRDVIMLVIGAVVLVGAIVGVVYGIATRTEAGLDDRMPRWSRDDMPLALCTFTHGMSYDEETGLAASPEHLEKTRYVVGLINERLGFQAYEMSGGDDCNVLLTYGVPIEAHGTIEPGGGAVWDGSQCMAETVNVHGEIETLVVHHELGHCLGLADDDAGHDQSIMRPEQRETEWRRMPPWISDLDRDLLRGLYR